MRYAVIVTVMIVVACASATGQTVEADAAAFSGDARARMLMAKAMAEGAEGQPRLILSGKAWLDRAMGAATSTECRQTVLALLIKGHVEAGQFDDASAIVHSVSDHFLSESPEALRAMRAEIAAGREQTTQRAEQLKRNEEAQLLRLQRESLNEQLKKAQADGDTAKADEIREALKRLTGTPKSKSPDVTNSSSSTDVPRATTAPATGTMSATKDQDRADWRHVTVPLGYIKPGTDKTAVVKIHNPTGHVIAIKHVTSECRCLKFRDTVTELTPGVNELTMVFDASEITDSTFYSKRVTLVPAGFDRCSHCDYRDGRRWHSDGGSGR